MRDEMYRYTLFVAVVVFFFSGTAAPCQAGVTVDRPNILFILTDDQGWATPGCYGNRLVATPNLDRLAADGMRFTDAYVMPQCSPTRAAFLTGQQAARTGMWHVIPWYGYPWAHVSEPAFTENLPRETFTIAKGLRSAGYVTGMAGKWHVTANADGHYVSLKPAAAGFYGFDFSAMPLSPHYPDSPDKGVDWLTDQAISFIEKNREHPWFFYLAHHTVHNPLSAPPEIVRKYRDRGAPETGLNNATFLAMLEHLDTSVGRLMKSLDDLGLRDRTLVVFESDNGGVHHSWLPKPQSTGDGNWHLAPDADVFDNAPLREGKGSVYEGGLRVPLMVRWPGITKAGEICHTPVHITDWLPTFLEIGHAVAPANHPLDGQSIVPLLSGGTIPPRPLFWYVPLYDIRWGATPCAVIRDGDWKLIESFGDSFDARGQYHIGRRLELFNLKEDLSESHDLAEADPQRRDALLGNLHGWVKRINATIPGVNPHADPARALEETLIKPHSGRVQVPEIDAAALADDQK